MLIILVLFQTSVISDDLRHGIESFDKGYYRIAESYFKSILDEKTRGPETIDACYYLSRIYEVREQLIEQISATDLFLREYSYDQRGNELFDCLVKRFVEIGSFTLALEYMKKYDYMKVDSVLSWNIATGLLEQKRELLADFMLAAMRQTDTVLILRASIADSMISKENFYRLMKSDEKYIYIAELALDNGDTLKAYDAYKSVSIDRLNSNMKFRYARLSLLFDRINAETYIDKLEEKSMLNKKLLLKSLYMGRAVKIEPQDHDEYDLLVECLNQSVVKPCSLLLVDSLIAGGVDYSILDSLKRIYGQCFILDSIKCEMLIDQDAYGQALQSIDQYQNYVNTHYFFRQVRGQYYFYKNNYFRAAVDLIVASRLPVDLELMLARSLACTGRKEYVRYTSILKVSADSLLRNAIHRDLIILFFEDREFDRVLEFMPDSIEGDTLFIRLMANSLAATGKIGIADSLIKANHVNLGSQVTDYYAGYLINTRKYEVARVFLDSIVNDSIQNDDAIAFKWALLPFIQGDHVTALERFQLFINKFSMSQFYCQACFKIATIMYFNQDFQQAVKYYGIAAHDDSLSVDALQNQMISAKKGALWTTAIDAGKKLIPFSDEDKISELLYDIGYAYLRNGRFRPAIEYLLKSVKVKPEPASLYWLAEAYFGRGDFIRALYYYRRITDVFPTDEMWAPTAYYKTGLVLEFMDEVEEARKIYETIIKKRGSQDTWSIEAQQRLDDLR